jgi:hypothetical protein
MDAKVYPFATPHEQADNKGQGMGFGPDFGPGCAVSLSGQSYAQVCHMTSKLNPCRAA